MERRLSASGLAVWRARAPLAVQLGIRRRMSSQSRPAAAAMAAAKTGGGIAQRPAWLQRIYADQSPAPRLYAWTRENLGLNLPRSKSRHATSTSALGDAVNRRRIFILGVGNLGRLYASSLAQLADPPPVCLVVHRKSLLEEWAARPGVEMTRGGGGVTQRFADLELEWWTEEKPTTGPVREVGANHNHNNNNNNNGDGRNGGVIANLVVATKAPDALAQADRLRRYLDARSTLAFVQNGMSPLWPPHGPEYCARRFGSDDDKHPNWLVCVTTHGVTSLGPFRSVHASPADVAVGPVLLPSLAGTGAESEASMEYLIGQITGAPHLAARRVSRGALWVLQLEKLVVNSVINPLSAVVRCKNGELFARPGSAYERVMDLLLAEASLVLQALVRDDLSSREILEADNKADRDVDEALRQGSIDARREALLERFSAPRLRAMLHRVGEKVRDNTSSMLQDVVAGKETEIRDFNGWLVDTADYLGGGGGMDLVNHKTLIELVERKAVLDDEDALARHFPAIGR